MQIGPKCTEIYYTATVNSSAVNYTLNMYSPNSYYAVKLIIPFSILPCPIGFTYTHGGICTCSSSITAENVTCHIDTLHNYISQRSIMDWTIQYKYYLQC